MVSLAVGVPDPSLALVANMVSGVFVFLYMGGSPLPPEYGAHFILRSLRNVRLAMAYSRFFVFNKKMGVAKLLLLNKTGSQLAVDTIAQNDWNLWRDQGVWNVAGVEESRGCRDAFGSRRWPSR